MYFERGRCSSDCKPYCFINNTIHLWQTCNGTNCSTEGLAFVSKLKILVTSIGTYLNGDNRSIMKNSNTNRECWSEGRKNVLVILLKEMESTIMCNM